MRRPRVHRRVPRTREWLALALVDFVERREVLRREESDANVAFDYRRRRLDAHEALWDAVVAGKPILGILDRLETERQIGSAAEATEVLVDWLDGIVQVVQGQLGWSARVWRKRDAFRAFLEDGSEPRGFADEFVDSFFGLWVPTEDEVAGLAELRRAERSGSEELVLQRMRFFAGADRRVGHLLDTLASATVVETLFGGTTKGRGAERTAELVVERISGIPAGRIRRTDRRETRAEVLARFRRRQRTGPDG